MSPLELLRSRLEEHGCNPRGNGNTIEFCCPLHDDHRASAGATLRDGRVLILCQVCGKERTGEILGKLGLTWRELHEDDDRKAKPEITATYDYVDEHGRLLYQVVRYSPKGFKQRRPDGRGGWIWNLKGTRRVLYRLPKVIEAVEAGRRVWPVEGEKDVHALEALGEVATTNPGGAGKWRDEYGATLRGADVGVIADSDEPGRAHGRSIVTSLTNVAASVTLFGVPGGRKDISEHLAAGCKLSDLEQLGMPKREPGQLSGMLLEDILGKVSDEDLRGVDTVEGLMKLLDGGKKSVASKIVDAVCAADVVLFHDDSGRGFASFEREGHRETHAIRSRAFKHYARHLFFELTKGQVPSGSAVEDAIGALDGQAIFRGEELPVHMRIAEQDGSIYLDLGDPKWRCVQVTRDGWRLLEDHPVRFIRTGAMHPLTEPKHGGDLNLLRAFLRVDDDDWRLVVGFLIACFRPGLPFPVLQLHGEHGSTKSTAAKVIRKLIDPNRSLLRKAPKTDDDLLVSASKSWVMTFENVSHIEPSLSDAICRLATGGGLSKRALYTDDDEVVLDVLRPVIITSIEEVATRPDLLDRAVLVELGAIDESDRVPEDEFWAGFDAIRGELLGAVLDAVAGALREVGRVRLERLPRMADFAKWVTAAERALGWEPGSFLSTYTENRGRSDEIAVDSAAIGRLLCEIADKGFEGSMTELLELLNTRADDKAQRSRSWPKNARALSGQVKRLSPNLRKLGYDVEHCPDTAAGSRNRAYRLSRREK